MVWRDRQQRHPTADDLIDDDRGRVPDGEKPLRPTGRVGANSKENPDDREVDGPVQVPEWKEQQEGGQAPDRARRVWKPAEVEARGNQQRNSREQRRSPRFPRPHELR